MRDDIDYHLDQVEAVMRSMVDAAEVMATEIARPYWERTKELRIDKTHNTTAWFKYSLSIRRETGTPRSPSDRLVIAWKKLRWVKTQKGNLLQSDSVKKKVDGTYAMSSFSDTGPEELRMIEAINSQMQKVWDMASPQFSRQLRASQNTVVRK